MKEQKVWRDFDALPPELQRQVVDFVSFLRARYTLPRKSTKRTRLAKESFIGMWRKRDDMRDSSAWTRNLREREWGKRNG